MGKMSKRKGSNTENTLAKILREHFMPDVDPKTAYQMVHRTPLSGGHVERGDLIIKPPVLKYFPWFIECRNRENWDWPQIWKQAEKSLIIRWFLVDAVEKCHPYDQNERYQRLPMLVFTKNQQPLYFAAWLEDLSMRGIEAYQFDSVMYVPITVDKQVEKKYVVIGDFERMLTLHPVPDTNVMQEQINTYLGVTNECLKGVDSG